ncbi:MAG: PilW family protein, partial [Gammaproteobacteria bacterium]
IPNAVSECDHAFGNGQTLVNDTIYLAENGVTGALFKHPEPSGIGGCVENRQLAPVLYYIQNFTTAGDGIPSLCRKVLQMGAIPNMTNECLVDGIEQLQIEYGIDTNGDGVASRYVSAPTADQFALVTSVRIHLLSRALRPDPNYTNPKTYVLGDLSFTPNDNFYRRAATTTVVVRNPTNLRNLGN